MEDLIFFIKNIFNPYKLEYSLAYSNYDYPKFEKKELDFIMYAKNENASNIFNKEEKQLIDPETKAKFSLMDRIRGIFSGRKGLPDPNQEYTMDDWINAQKNPVSRLLNNIAHKTSTMVKNALARRENEKSKNINIPSTPSQNFEMSQNTSQQENRTIIVPVEKNVQNVKKPFVPLKVENIDLDDKGLEEAKVDIIKDEDKLVSHTTDKSKSDISVENVNFDSKGLEEAKTVTAKDNKESAGKEMELE